MCNLLVISLFCKFQVNFKDAEIKKEKEEKKKKNKKTPKLKTT